MTATTAVKPNIARPPITREAAKACGWDFSSTAQRRRQRVQAHYRRCRNVDRDRAIIRDRMGGATFRELAVKHRLSVGGAHYIVKRTEPICSATGPLPLRTGARYRFAGPPRRKVRPRSVYPRTVTKEVKLSHPFDSLLEPCGGDFRLTARCRPPPKPWEVRWRIIEKNGQSYYAPPA